MDPINTGPVDVILLKFPGNRFNGRILPAIGDLINRQLIRVLDLMFVWKDDQGTVGSLELAKLSPDLDEYVEIIQTIPGGYLDDEDVEEIAPDLEPNSSVAALAVENLWAIPFVDAVRDADGEVMDQFRVPADLVAEYRDLAREAEASTTPTEVG
ncbi:MAG: hypothetical protein J2P22_00035 [Nocardioides sp.]|nr:hypothetical protein [Nocardioides sp.]